MISNEQLSAPRRSRRRAAPESRRPDFAAMRPTRTLGAFVSAGVLLAGMAACGGDEDPQAQDKPAASAAPAGATAKRANGVEKLSAEEILKQSREAALRAGSAHFVARFVRKDGILDIDTTVRGTTGSGTITVKGLGAEVRRIDDTVFLKGNDAFNEASAGSEGAKLLAGKWLFGPADHPALKDAAGSLNYETVVNDALRIDGDLVKEKVTTFAGYRAIRLRDDDSYIYVALDGKPYPMAVRGLTGSTDRIRLSQWGKEVNVERPAESDLIDIVKQLSQAEKSEPPTTTEP